MARALIVINGNADREKAHHWIDKAPAGARITFQAAKRTDDQNAKMWAMLTEVAEQVKWHGLKLAADDWKLIFMSGLKRELRMVPNIDGDGFVNLSTSSSDLSKGEMSDLIELMFQFGANPDHPVTFQDSQSSAPSADAGSGTATMSSVGDPAAEISPADEAGTMEEGDNPGQVTTEQAAPSSDLSDEQKKKLFLLEECATSMFDAATHEASAERADRLDKARMARLSELPDDKEFVQNTYKACARLIENPAGRDQAMPFLMDQARKWMGVA